MAVLVVDDDETILHTLTLLLKSEGMECVTCHSPQEALAALRRDSCQLALVGQPKVLLADEPTGNLDSRNAQVVMDLLGALHKQGGTIVMVTHDPRSAEQAQRQISLFDGKVVDDRRTYMTTAAA